MPCSCMSAAAWLSESAGMATIASAPVTCTRPEDCTWIAAYRIACWKPSVGNALEYNLVIPPRRSEEPRLAFKIPACLRPRPTPLLAEILQRDLDALVVHALELSLELLPTLGAA